MIEVGFIVFKFSSSAKFLFPQSQISRLSLMNPVRFRCFLPSRKKKYLSPPTRCTRCALPATSTLPLEHCFPTFQRFSSVCQLKITCFILLRLWPSNIPFLNSSPQFLSLCECESFPMLFSAQVLLHDGNTLNKLYCFLLFCTYCKICKESEPFYRKALEWF